MTSDVKVTCSIGEAVDRLRATFPDLSISKVRYLEDEGLLSLQRTKGGYRLFSEADLARLSEILRLQKEYFLPLTVIKERMKTWRVGQSITVDSGEEEQENLPQPAGPVPLAKALQKTGTNSDTIKTLESFGLIALLKEGDQLVVSEADFKVLKVFVKLSRFGIEPRHLRMYENQAQREAMLFQQILTPTMKHQSPKTRSKTQVELKELLGMTEELKRVILHKALRTANLAD